MKYLLISVAAMVISLALTPLMIVVSRRWKLMDMPNGRKEHAKPMPLLGGIAIYLATVVTTAVYVLFFVHSLQQNIIIAFFIGISGVTTMGLVDDILLLSAKRRLVILFVLALIVLVGCLQFYFPPSLFQSVFTAIATSFIVVFWIVAITNAVNFSDGLDGLASSLSLVSAFGFAAIFFWQGRTQLALPATLALCGAIAGFLPYNLSPAKIFMGDAGSMFIGFMLGILTIMSMSQKTVVVFVVPVFLILVPIADMCMSVLRRLLLKMPVMQPDKMHFHHMLNRRFKNHRIVVLILVLAQILFAGIGVVIYIKELYLAGWILLAFLAVAAIIYTVLKARKLKQMGLQNGG